MGHVGEELRLVLAGDLELTALLLNLVEETNILECDHRLIRECLQQRYLALRERSRLSAVRGKRADGNPFAEERNTDRGPDARVASHFRVLTSRLRGLGVGHVDCRAVDDGAAALT